MSVVREGPQKGRRIHKNKYAVEHSKKGKVKIKVKLSRYRPGVAHRLGRGMALFFHDRGTRRGKWSAARSGRTLPRERTGSHFTGGWVGLRDGMD